MEVLNGRFNAGEFVYVLEVPLAMILAHLERHMFAGDLVVSMVYMEFRLFRPDG